MDRSAFSKLTAPDAATALRSFRRRYGAAFRPAERGEVADDGSMAVVDMVGPDGRSPRDLVIDTTKSLGLLTDSLHKVAILTDAVVVDATLDRSKRAWDVAPAGSMKDELDLLEAAAIAFADRIDAVPFSDWTRSGSAEGGGDVGALDIIQEAMATATGNLTELDGLLEKLRLQ